MGDEYQRREAILADIRREAVEREARASVALDEGQTHSVCGVDGCQQCHCHECATQVSRERDEARGIAEALARRGSMEWRVYWQSKLPWLKRTP